MNFLVLLLVGLILLWSPWQRGYPRDLLQPWVQRAGAIVTGWRAVAAVLALLLPIAALLWLVQGVAYGFLTLLLHVALMLLCVGRHDPLRGFGREFVSAWRRGDQTAAALVAEQQLGVVDSAPAGLLTQVRARMAATCLQDYLVPAFWYLLVGPLGALAYRLLELLRQQGTHAAVLPAGMLVHALEWIPARLMALSFALVGQFESTLRTLRSLAAQWELSAGELVARCAAAALSTERGAEDIAVIDEQRQLLVRCILSWAVIIAFLSLLG